MSGAPPYATLQEHQVIIALHNGTLPLRPPSICDSLWDLCELCFKTPRDRLHAELLLKGFRALSKDLLLGLARSSTVAQALDLDLLDELLVTAFNHFQENVSVPSPPDIPVLMVDHSCHVTLARVCKSSNWILPCRVRSTRLYGYRVRRSARFASFCFSCSKGYTVCVLPL